MYRESLVHQTNSSDPSIRHSTSAVLDVAFLQGEDDKSAKCPSHQSGSTVQPHTLRVVHAHK
jgi:hypothetical protein